MRLDVEAGGGTLAQWQSGSRCPAAAALDPAGAAAQPARPSGKAQKFGYTGFDCMLHHCMLV
jgi:hypothetical protein